jgi:hypothetical protein
MKSMASETLERLRLDPSTLCVGTPTTDISQDHPAAWDWRVLLAFIGAGLLALYYL